MPKRTGRIIAPPLPDEAVAIAEAGLRRALTYEEFTEIAWWWSHFEARFQAAFRWRVPKLAPETSEYIVMQLNDVYRVLDDAVDAAGAAAAHGTTSESLDSLFRGLAIVDDLRTWATAHVPGRKGKVDDLVVRLAARMVVEREGELFRSAIAKANLPELTACKLARLCASQVFGRYVRVASVKSAARRLRQTNPKVLPGKRKRVAGHRG